MILSKNFTLKELTFSDYATRHGIDNSPPQPIMQELSMLCIQLLEPLRTYLQSRIHVTSGYRCPELNQAIGGSPTSQHMKGQAADFTADAWSNLEVLEKIMHSHLQFDQLILEGDPVTGWIHISRSDNPRHEVLRAIFVNGKAVYSPYSSPHNTPYSV